jgi:quercetin dioxygenase-like cupin family protein
MTSDADRAIHQTKVSTSARPTPTDTIVQWIRVDADAPLTTEETRMTKQSAVLLALTLSSGTVAAQDPELRALITKDLTGVPGKELAMITVEYGPGGSDTAHRHHAHTMVYVLEGSIVMQIKGAAPVTLGPGQTYFEGPDDIHVVSRNASSTARAKFVVFFVKDKGAPFVVRGR